MAMWYEGRITLIDEHGFKSQVVYDLGVSVDSTGAASAIADLNSIAAELVDVTDANMMDIYVACHDDTNVTGTLPAEAEIAEECVLSVHLLAAPLPQKLGTLRIPAPSDGIFQADGYTVDTADLDLLAYVAAVAAATTISDGENIITARGSGGIAAGSWRTRARKAPK